MISANDRQHQAGVRHVLCISNKIPLKMLCNVAGLGGASDYLKIPLDTLHYMVDLNVKMLYLN